MKNSNKTYIVIICLLLLIIIFLGGYIVYDKAFEKNNTTNTSNDTTNETADSSTYEVLLSDPEIEKYISYIMPKPFSFISDKEYLNADSLSAKDKIEYARLSEYAELLFYTDQKYTPINTLSEEDVKNFVEKIYGPNTYSKTTFTLGCGEYVLNEVDHKYYYSKVTGCGGTTAGWEEYNTIIGYKKSDNKLEITTAYVRLRYDHKLFKKSGDSEPITTIPDNITDTDNYLKAYIQNNQDKLYHLIYTFESNDGINYYFKELKNTRF